MIMTRSTKPPSQRNLNKMTSDKSAAVQTGQGGSISHASEHSKDRLNSGTV